MSLNTPINLSIISGKPTQAVESSSTQKNNQQGSIFNFNPMLPMPFMMGGGFAGSSMVSNMGMYMQLMQNMMWEFSNGVQKAPDDLSSYQKDNFTSTKEHVFSSDNTKLGEKIAFNASKTANFLDSKGYCARGVRMALQSTGIDYNGVASAYQATPQLKQHPDFKEMKVEQGELKNLPAGAIVVWSKSNANPHGHISVALGNGYEASDHVRPQLERLNSRSTSTPRVFLPVDKTPATEYIV